jgi:hypothetical protein
VLQPGISAERFRKLEALSRRFPILGFNMKVRQIEQGLEVAALVEVAFQHVDRTGYTTVQSRMDFRHCPIRICPLLVENGEPGACM